VEGAPGFTGHGHAAGGWRLGCGDGDGAER
jgi:hypothetical protein